MSPRRRHRAELCAWSMYAQGFGDSCLPLSFTYGTAGLDRGHLLHQSQLQRRFEAAKRSAPLPLAASTGAVVIPQAGWESCKVSGLSLGSAAEKMLGHGLFCFLCCLAEAGSTGGQTLLEVTPRSEKPSELNTMRSVVENVQ